MKKKINKKFVSVRMYECMYARMHACMSVCVCICLCLYIRYCIYICVRVHVCIYIFFYFFLHIYIYMGEKALSHPQNVPKSLVVKGRRSPLLQRHTQVKPLSCQPV